MDRHRHGSPLIRRPTLMTITLLLVLIGCGSNGGDADVAKTVHAPTLPAQAVQVNAGTDQVVRVGQTVQLSGSTTPQSTQNIQWQFTSVPAGSTAELIDADTLTPRFVPDLAGLYVVTLSMNKAQSDQVTVEAQANLVTLHFHGALRTDVVITGTFTYEPTIGPNATNVRSLSPNVLYRLTAWDFVVESALVGVLPSTTYRSGEPGNTAEFCEGVCIFSSDSFLELRFANTGTTVLSLLFEVRDPTPFINPPNSLSEWGPFVEGTYRVPCPACGPLAVIKDGALSS
ncbi:MAG TPA: hypothetical protein VJL88_09900 [Nitrospira sp.]|nr:hypothetical protein [Nitrospira sp.]